MNAAPPAGATRPAPAPPVPIRITCEESDVVASVNGIVVVLLVGVDVEDQVYTYQKCKEPKNEPNRAQKYYLLHIEYRSQKGRRGGANEWERSRCSFCVGAGGAGAGAGRADNAPLPATAGRAA
ncbi:hypothetical protein EVAR_61105_1 [Eumeta japonica]|uniref:Uncharacterized protein n=1 Tax=Eumeta variegata TaxID=151549 RepID=A0A4C1YQ36_EUMVA|nr:hypothetical protein EVAR_61105_1 [Eumeta japonica]